MLLDKKTVTIDRPSKCRDCVFHHDCDDGFPDWCWYIENYIENYCDEVSENYFLVRDHNGRLMHVSTPMEADEHGLPCAFVERNET